MQFRLKLGSMRRLTQAFHSFEARKNYCHFLPSLSTKNNRKRMEEFSKGNRHFADVK